MSGYIIEYLEEELTKNAGVDKERSGALDYEAEAADSNVLERHVGLNSLHNISSTRVLL